MSGLNMSEAVLRTKPIANSLGIKDDTKINRAAGVLVANSKTASKEETAKIVNNVLTA